MRKHTHQNKKLYIKRGVQHPRKNTNTKKDRELKQVTKHTVFTGNQQQKKYQEKPTTTKKPKMFDKHLPSPGEKKNSKLPQKEDENHQAQQESLVGSACT